MDLFIKFIVRRAYRCGSTSRADLLKATDISPSTASRAISSALATLGHILERNGHDIVPKPLAECPSYASEADLLEHIDSGKNDALHTGLFEKELPITYVSWTNSMPPSNGTFSTIVRAIRRCKQIDIIYLGIRRDEQPRKRKILPLSLEKMNDQWRVIAQDLEDEAFPIKIFVLPRILTASKSEKSTRIPFAKGHVDSKTKLSIALDHKYTEQQKRMLEYELKAKDGKISIPTRSLHEFKRRFANTPVSDNAIWPPLIIKSE